MKRQDEEKGVGVPSTRGLRGPSTLAWMVLVAVACGDGAQSPSTDPTFTGEVKPVLYVTDVEASAPFFRDVLGFHFLGFSTLDGAPYYAEMSAGSLKFGLHEPMTAEQETWVGHQRIYFRVRDLRAQRDRVVAAGGAPGEIVETDWMDMFIVRDPAGHEIVFAATDLSKHTMDPW